VGAPGLLSCGGSVSVPPTPVEGEVDSGVPAPDAHAEADAGRISAPDADTDAGGVCRLVSPTVTLGGGCGQTWFQLEGTTADCGQDDAGALPLDRCAALCPVGLPGFNEGAAVVSCTVDSCLYCAAGPTTVPEIVCIYGVVCGTGRRPSGLRRPSPRRTRGVVGSFLARMAHLESASVAAFACLERELRDHGAPRDLLARAQRARRDEVRHARVMTGLAARAGADVAPACVEVSRTRTLEAIAIENAVEGCVRETYGAAVAGVQSATATDALIRDAMRAIARDELRHAELSWSVAKWLETKLDAPARDRVRRARHRAARELLESASQEAPAEIMRELGLPGARLAAGIARDLRDALWA
jgi:hypothetical protein